jgi:hypothetical protein
MANGEAPSCYKIADNRTALKALALYPLDQIPSNLPFTTECRNQIIGNAVHCALYVSQSVVDSVGKFQYDGHEGLAPGWLTDPLTIDAGRWVTACMIQRLNATGQHVNILPEGNTRGIYKDSNLESLYPVNESNAWGNFFDPNNTTGYDGYVCYTDEVLRACGSSASPEDWFNSRYCDGSGDAGAGNPCYLKLMGPCSSACLMGSTGYALCLRPDGTYDDHTVHVRLQEPPTCSAQ